MSRKGQSVAPKSHSNANHPNAAPSTALQVIRSGEKTADRFIEAMWNLMGDILGDTVTPAQGQAACKAGQNLMKMLEMQERATKGGHNGQPKQLKLTKA